MASVSKIPEALWETVREQARGGWSTRKTADWLREVHDLKVSHSAVAELLQRLRDEEETERQAERAEEAAARRATREAVRERVAASLDLDLTALDDQGKRLHRIARQLYRRVRDNDLDHTISYLRAEEALRKAIEMRLKLAGVDPDDDKNEMVAAAAQLRRKLAEKLAPAGAGGGAERDRSDGDGQGRPPLRVVLLGSA